MVFIGVCQPCQPNIAYVVKNKDIKELKGIINPLIVYITYYGVFYAYTHAYIYNAKNKGRLLKDAGKKCGAVFSALYK
jgi:hypothetical protein